MKGSQTFFLAALVMSLLSSAPTSAFSAREDLVGHYQRGNKAYVADKDYESAIEEYLKAQAGGVRHPDLYFSLANAYYLSGRKGLAILYYEKTLDLDPGYGGATTNLEIVRKELIDRVVMPTEGAVGEPSWHGFLRGISLGWLTWGFLASYLMVFAVLIARRLGFKEMLNRLLFWVNVPLLALTLVFGVLLGARIYIQERVHHGVIIPVTTSLLVGPERFAKEHMEVHEGLKVQLLDEVGDFVRVRLANGVEGYLRDSHIGRI